MNMNAQSGRKALAVLLAISFLAITGYPDNAQAQVDMRGKKGVVDPKDLKKYDPKPQPLRIKEPPRPQPAKAPGGDSAPKSPPSDQGGDPGKQGVPVRAKPHPDWKPPGPPKGTPAPVPVR